MLAVKEGTLDFQLYEDPSDVKPTNGEILAPDGVIYRGQHLLFAADCSANNVFRAIREMAYLVDKAHNKAIAQGG